MCKNEKLGNNKNAGKNRKILEKILKFWKKY